MRVFVSSISFGEMWELPGHQTRVLEIHKKTVLMGRKHLKTIRNALVLFEPSRLTDSLKIADPISCNLLALFSWVCVKEAYRFVLRDLNV